MASKWESGGRGSFLDFEHGPEVASEHTYFFRPGTGTGSTWDSAGTLPRKRSAKWTVGGNGAFQKVDFLEVGQTSRKGFYRGQIDVVYSL